MGAISIAPPILLAPMEDVTNAAFRLLVKRIAGPGLMFTEFVSARAIEHGSKRSLNKIRIHPGERPLGVQIFGDEPGVMAETARICEEMGADLVDINMGCWVPKVCKTGSGAALLKDPDTAEAIVREVVRAVRVPVTVKVRAGWTHSQFAAPELAKRFEGVGAKMITLHARFAKQGFEGEADWKLIEELRKAVSIPLVGNGDIRESEDALRMFEITGCDGVMVGRAAISNPWALRRIIEGVQGLPQSQEPSIRERAGVALEHLRALIELYESEEYGPQRKDSAELRAVRNLRGQIQLYIKGIPGAAAMRQSLMKMTSFREIEDALLGLSAGDPLVSESA